MPVPPARRRAGLALLLLLVPLAYLAAVWSLQPADHLGDPPAAPWLGRLFYDDYDSTARALRGLNAELGRPAGQLGHPPTSTATSSPARCKRLPSCGRPI